jgi:hypothetical protein
MIKKKISILIDTSSLGILEEQEVTKSGSISTVFKAVKSYLLHRMQFYNP